MTPLRRRLLSALVGALAVLAAVPGAASAEIVFDRGNDIWAAQDDGSQPHLLVTAASLGMDAGLGDPAVAPNGSTLLFTGMTHANPSVDPIRGGIFYGNNAAGVYELSGGAVTRLSGPAQGTGTPSETDELQAEPAPGGQYVYQHEECVPQTTYWDLPRRACGGWLRTAPLARGAAGATGYPTACDGQDGIPTTPPSAASPDPASAALRLAYVGCLTPDNSLTGGTASQNQLVVSGPGGQGRVTVALGPEASNAAIGEPDLADPSWSPDGTQLVVYDAGGTNYTTQTSIPGGLYVFSDLSQTNAGRLVLQDPLDGGGDAEWIRSPRFDGNGRILFVLAGSVYAVPASCNACPLSSATKLYDGGSDPSTQSFSVGWTSGSVAPVAASAGGGQTGGRQTGGGGGAVALTIGRLHTQRLASLRRHGVPVKVRCSTACRLTVRLELPARGRPVVLGTAHGAGSAGHWATARVRLTRKGARRLGRRRRRKLVVWVDATAGGHAAGHAMRKVVVRR